MKRSASVFLLFVLVCGSAPLYAQDRKPHSANQAALYSALLPGSGQAYNRKYWKIPVIYAGFGTMAYFITTNNREFVKFRDAYDFKSGNTTDPDKYNAYVDKYSLTSLQAGKTYYRRNRDLSIIVTSLWYLLNITDAAVDAYLFDYDVSPDLSLHISPMVPPPVADLPPVQGISLKITF